MTPAVPTCSGSHGALGHGSLVTPAHWESQVSPGGSGRPDWPWTAWTHSPVFPPAGHQLRWPLRASSKSRKLEALRGPLSVERHLNPPCVTSGWTSAGPSLSPWSSPVTLGLCQHPRVPGASSAWQAMPLVLVHPWRRTSCLSAGRKLRRSPAVEMVLVASLFEAGLGPGSRAGCLLASGVRMCRVSPRGRGQPQFFS